MKSTLFCFLKYLYLRHPGAFIFSLLGGVCARFLEAGSFLLLLMCVDAAAVANLTDKIHQLTLYSIEGYTATALVLSFFVLFNLSKLIIYQVGVWTAKLSRLAERHSTLSGFSYIVSNPVSNYKLGPEGIYGYVNWCPRFIARISFMLLGSASSVIVVVASLLIMLYLQPLLSLLLMIVALPFIGAFRNVNRQAQYHGKAMKVLAKYFYKSNIRLVQEKSSSLNARELLDSHGDALFRSFAQRVLASFKTTYLTGLAFSVFVLVCAIYFLTTYPNDEGQSVHSVIIYFITSRYLFSAVSAVLATYTKIHNLYPPVKNYFTRAYISLLLSR